MASVLLVEEFETGEQGSSGRSRSVPTLRELAERKSKLRELAETKRQKSIPLNTGRTLGRHVSLGPGWDLNRPSQELPPATQPVEQEVVPLQYQGPGLKERVVCYCVSASFDRFQLQQAILKRTSSLQAFSEVLCCSYHRIGENTQGWILYFDFGCVVFWGLDATVERHVLREIVAPCMQHPLPALRVEKDRLCVQYTTNPRHYIFDDSLALHYRFADDLEIKLAISFALAQSTKLSTYEERMRDSGKQLAYLPAMMAELGKINISERQIMRHLGELFLQMSAVNLLGKVLDTPDALSQAPDHIGTLYKSVFDYLEVNQRVHLLNDRYAVLQEMLDILRVHAQKSYSEFLETLVMWLVAICAIVGMFQLLALLGWIPKK